MIDGRQYHGIYPPTHFLLYLPLALITDDWHKAGRILFAVNVAALFLLSVLTWWLIVRLMELSGEERRWSMLLIPLGFAILAGNVASGYALERGDGGDILAATFCWSALVLFLKGWRFLPLFLLVPAMFTKGYAVLCGVGFAVWSPNPRDQRRTMAGIFAGVGVFLLPVIHYLPESWVVLRGPYLLNYDSFWWNHGFRNLFDHLSPALAEPGRWIMGGYCMVLSIACWQRAKQALRQEDPKAALWGTFFVTCSLETMLGIARNSFVYNLVLVLPGIVIFLLVAPSLARSCGYPAWVVHAVGVGNVLAAFFLFKFVIFDMTQLPAPGIGIFLFLISLGVVIKGLWTRRVGVADPA